LINELSIPQIMDHGIDVVHRTIANITASIEFELQQRSIRFISPVTHTHLRVERSCNDQNVGLAAIPTFPVLA
jgi:hypothetical protein